MKRILSFTCALIILLTMMVSCSSSLSAGETAETGETEAETETEGVTAEKVVRDPTGFCAGFARTTINPTSPTGMGGYGNTARRLSTSVADDITASCTAVSDGETTALFFSIDVLGLSETNRDTIYKQVEKALGIPSELVTISATHSHSSPAVSSNDDSVMVYMRIFYPAILKVAKEAVADLDRCEMKIGRTETKDLSYVRRYYREDGSFTGVNYVSDNDSPIVRHETEVDPEMQLLMFDRVNGKDIVMVNWQCHVTTAGGSENTVISSDWVGSLRDTAEKEADILVSYHQGGAGNVVPNSSIESEPDNSDYRAHGKKIARVLVDALPTLESVPTGKIRGISSNVFCSYEKDTSAYNLEHAAEIQRYYQNGNMDQAKALCLLYGYSSPYHANNVMSMSVREGEGMEMRVSAVAIGDIGFAVAPYEMFDTNGMEIKSGSPFTMTFVCAYSNGSYGYIPSSNSWPNGGYEVDTCRFKMGTGEQLAQALVGMLSQIKE